ncbi:molybdopterin/thiamine biosynthesis adenylyltransferase [Amaricoccus macauensis]|uniref:Molybdopterin/thiamine biosynthesis adenylyltransferase n=1 Tax=Amaricoccus macauensis TaxID=57001 RepID=A0A840SS29_9RHOB|nr:HesA/MoeB/ThiF family protein [Amaricoccus macauensis]MBB5223368.1 molybdopterin/thiamine biosynthesis adenylyltransferase [Amaricoccus macauensis]
MSRYARQIVLPEVGDAGQARLAAAHVLVVGAGGLGVPVLQYLAGAGVGAITLVDPDRVERGNLHRQTLFGESRIGLPKAEAAAAVLADLNPEVRVTPLVTSLDPSNAPGLVAAADVVLDCADSFAASYVLSDACLAAAKPFISASALGLGGYVGGFCGGAPSLRAVFPDLPERAATCATAGVLGPVVGLLGMLQAQMALGILLGLAPSPLGQVVSYEAAGLRFSGFRFDGAPEPEHALRFLAPGAIEAGDFVVDLRGAEEAPVPAAPQARRAGVEAVTDGPLPLPGQRAVLACRSGLRAWAAARRLERVWDGPILLVAMGDPVPALEAS